MGAAVLCNYAKLASGNLVPILDGTRARCLLSDGK